MNWAKKRADRFLDRMRDERLHREVTYDDYIDGFATELQRVADECAGVADQSSGIAPTVADAIRARFPKEGQ